jgi:hypothetical protein
MNNAQFKETLKVLKDIESKKAEYHAKEAMIHNLLSELSFQTSLEYERILKREEEFEVYLRTGSFPTEDSV